MSNLKLSNGEVHPKLTKLEEYIKVNKLPFIHKKKVKYDKSQYGSTHFLIDSKGKFHIRTWFSQGKKFDGDSFGFVAVLLNENKERLYVTKFRKGINGRGTGGTKVVRMEDSTNLPEWAVDDVKYVYVKFFKYQKRDDAKIWAGIGDLIRRFLEANSDEPAEGAKAGA